MSPKLLNILLILIPTIIYYGLFDPLYNGNPGFIWTPERTISSLKSDMVQYQSALSQFDIIEKEIKKVDVNYKAVPQDVIDKIDVMLPPSVDQLRLRNEVQTIANKAGLALTDVQVVPDGVNIGAFLVTFTTRSTYPRFKKFIENYERNKRFYTLVKMGINKPDLKGEVGTELSKLPPDVLLETVTFRVYSFKQK